MTEETTRPIGSTAEGGQLDPVVRPEIQYTDEAPTETGWYYHQNGNGADEIVFLDFSGGGFWIHKIHGDQYPLREDKGRFGPRIALPYEEA